MCIGDRVGKGALPAGLCGRDDYWKRDYKEVHKELLEGAAVCVRRAIAKTVLKRSVVEELLLVNALDRAQLELRGHARCPEVRWSCPGGTAHSPEVRFS